MNPEQFWNLQGAVWRAVSQELRGTPSIRIIKPKRALPGRFHFHTRAEDPPTFEVVLEHPPHVGNTVRFCLGENCTVGDIRLAAEIAVGRLAYLLEKR